MTGPNTSTTPATGTAPGTGAAAGTTTPTGTTGTTGATEGVVGTPESGYSSDKTITAGDGSTIRLARDATGLNYAPDHHRANPAPIGGWPAEVVRNMTDEERAANDALKAGTASTATASGASLPTTGTTGGAVNGNTSAGAVGATGTTGQGSTTAGTTGGTGTAGTSSAR